MASKYINSIQNMSFNELRDELMNCDNNPIKEYLIRRLMKEKYIYYKKRKNYIINKRHQLEKERYELFKKHIENSIEEQEEPVYLKDDDYISPLENSDIRNHNFSNLYDKKFTNEIEKDRVNNNLMDRMNSELEIRKFNSNVKKDFEPPYDSAGKSLVNINTITPNNFSSKRIIRNP